MALLTMALLTALMLALASISQTEPIIAANQLRGSQARTLAESGLEYALWALANPARPGELPALLPAPAPFDGQTFIPFGLGGFTVTVAGTPGGDPNRRTITSVGWMPTNSPTDARPKGHRTLSVDVAAVPRLGHAAPCALCARGVLDVTGNVAIDGRNRDAACGDDAKFGTFSRDATTLTGPVAQAGGAGAGAQHQPAAAFDAVTLSPAALDALKTLAWRSGTYYGPGFPGGGTVSDGSTRWSAHLVFDASHPLPDGIVFIDTADGREADGEGAAATRAVARIDAGAVTARGGMFRGWIVVNGSLEMTGALDVRGLVYAVDGLSYQAAGAGRIEGLVVALNASNNAAPVRVEAAAGGSLAIAFDCPNALGTGLVPRSFLPIPGTYREE
jgi:hypothetical protein